MDRTRVIFIIFAAIALTVLTGSAYTYVGRPQPFGQPTSKSAASSKRLPVSTQSPGSAAVFANSDAAKAAQAAQTSDDPHSIVLKDGRLIKPIFARNAQLGDGLPSFVCGTVASGSYYALQLIQTAKLDIKNKFHLGIVPYDLSGDYEMSEEDVAQLMHDGKLDCLLTTLDTVALHDHGIVTAINSEGAGTDQLWVRDANTLNDLKDKRIVSTKGDSNEYLVHYLLSTVRLDPQKDVKMIYVDTLDEALQIFEDGDADAISGYEPAIQAAQQAGGKLLASTRDFRAVIDVIVASRQAVAEHSDDVLRFHRAWFQALALQAEDFNAAAEGIAAWGNNSYTGIRPGTAARDFRAQLELIAQANLAQNDDLMQHTTILLNRMNEARNLWAKAGLTLPKTTPNVDAGYVLKIAQEYRNNHKPMEQAMVNDTFSLAPSNAISANPKGVLETVRGKQMIAVLPCSRFEFEPDTTDLMPASQQLLDECVVRTMRESVGLLLRIRGSSAWPGPKGSISQDDVEQMARARAEAVATYLKGKGIPVARLRIEAVIPPPEHRETMDESIQAKDRYVEMALMTGGQ